MLDKKKLFALDIGTRSVVGIILEEHNQQYHVVDMLAIEHSERAMLDGQIHDVLSVSKIITEIKQQLEKKHGPLHKVSVAAAGRALRTERAEVIIDIKGKPMIQKEDILHIELSAVQKAQSSVAEKHDEERSHYYYCVGYSVLYYRLDGEEIGNLIDQQGDEASVEIIATFLPKVVVESLISALHRANLEMEALTLEPIAAINVLIPPTMRRLNVALVDIGAGTSDIALTDSGTVIAYGMVPVAGDEITEAISDQLLLDFPLAETAKRELHTNDSITVTDILGFETEFSKSDVIAQISPAIDRLAESICEEIYNLNGHKSPKAVMLVGGGSQTPELPKRIAEKLNLPENRVAIRGIDAIQSLTIDEQITKGPELVTPIGIAIAAQKTPVHYVTVYVNEQPVRLFEVKKLTVGDCLLAAGIKMNKLYGKPGLAMIVTLNGQQITIPGEHGGPPKLLKNESICSLDDEVQNGDQLTVVSGADGEKNTLQIKELLDEVPRKTVSINGEEYQITTTITQNGKVVSPDVLIEDRDSIECKIPETIDEVLISLNLRDLVQSLKPFRVTLDHKETFLPTFSGRLFRNGMEVKLHSSFEHLDEIVVEKKRPITVRELAEKKQMMLNHTLPVFFNGQELELKKTITEFRRKDQILSEEDTIQDGDVLTHQQKRFKPFIFQDLFNFVEVEMPARAQGNFRLLKNNQQTTFYDQIDAGDHLQIVWENRKSEA
ncbi:cell division protein FtsA [Robertmurraya kyonggiensis]|uniref:Cell division protein FtsA n=1 Tax=Robertmurraya kyonggiensis TaxID=1037680 RepID=A0A4U1D3Y8_9BACI|nr:cell division protein FtsA [Robertmurraya kyonggiensis]TKC15846.1 cell division protein FtsA [Robertmurraya kyonggiensis]